MIDRLLTKQNARELLGISLPTLDRLVARGDLPVVRVGERAIRISESAIRNLVERRTERRGHREDKPRRNNPAG